ncbi:MAG: response regulator [Alcanivoracaceae bacterium]|nr:response regulator [Alcanivoracaceae bacterium]
MDEGRTTSGFGFFPVLLLTLLLSLLGGCSDDRQGGDDLQLATFCPQPGESLPDAAQVLGQGSLGWTPVKGQRLSLSPADQQCWVRVTMPAPHSASPQTRLLVIDNPRIALIRFYASGSPGGAPNTDIRHYRAGADLAHDSRPVVGPFPAFPIPETGADSSTAYLALSAPGKLQFQARVLSRSAYQHLALVTTASQSAISGALFLLAVWLLVLYAAHRDNLMFYLGLCLALSSLAFFNLNGLGHMLLWPDSPTANQYLYPILTPLLTMLTAMAGRDFLARNGVSETPALTVAIRTAFVLLLATPFLPRYPLLVTDLAVLMATLAALAGYCRTDSTTSRVRGLGIASLVLMLSLALSYAAFLGVLPYHPLWQNQLQLVALVIAVLMALIVIVPQRRQADAGEALSHPGARAEDRALQTARSRFLVSLSHQIRTPLNGILGMADLLRRNKDLPGPGKQQAETIYQAATALVSNVNDMLDHSAIQQGTLQLSLNPVQPDDMLSDVIDLFAQASRRKDVPIYCYIDSRVPHEIITDEMRVKQVLTNLVSNALRHTDTGRIDISISTRELDTRLNTVTLNIDVSDTGCGLDEATRAQLDSAQNNGNSGLQISRQLVSLLGGELTCTGAPGHGASFCFTLPARVRPAPPLCLDQRQVTVLTDSMPLRLSISQMLHRWGVRCHDTDLAALDSPPEISGQQALVMDAASFNALDTMPGCTWPDVPLVVVGAAFTTSDDSATGIPLPLKPRMLKHALANVLAEPDRSSTDNALKPPSPGISVLVVDDDQVSQMVIASLLQSLQVQTRTVGSGEEALDALDREKAQVVFLDWEMPGMDGEEVARRIRQAHPQEDIWIICLTAHGADAVMEKARAAGVDDFLPKPVNRQQVRTALRRAQSSVTR